jgi:hypothetical protein
MKMTILFSTLILATVPLLAAPKDDVTTAATALRNAANYSWQTTQDSGPNSQYKPGPMDAKTEKDGFTVVSMNINSNALGFVRKSTNFVVHSTDSGWQTMAEASHVYTVRGPGTAVSLALDLQLPAVEATNLIAWVNDWKADGDKITGTLTEDGATRVLGYPNSRYGRPSIPPGVGGSIYIATASNAKGTVTFWITDGMLTKYQTHATGSIDSNGGRSWNEDLTKTVTIKDIGTTKIVVPDDAKKKLE